jgi:chromosome segregation ATPase
MESSEVSLIVNAVQTVNDNVTEIRADMRVLRQDVNQKIDELKEQLKEHEKTDKEYWKQIDVRQGQLFLLKGLTISSFGLWVWEHFKDQFGLK